MCGFALAVKGISTAFAAYSTLQQGKQQKEAYEYQAAQEEAQGRSAASAAKARADKIRRAGEAKQGAARANLAASGVDVNAGTSVDINSKIGKNAEEDALVEIMGGESDYRTSQTSASNLRSAGSNANNSSLINAGSTLLAGGYQVAKGWRTAKGVN